MIDLAGTRELAGEVAIVTGAALNTGRTIARTLASAGAAVVVNYRTSEQAALGVVAEIERDGGRAISCQADVSDPEQAERLAATASEHFGDTTILVNNANVRDYRPITEITPDDWHRTIATTLDGAFFCIRACLPHMRRRGKGTIINMGGGSAHAGAANRCHVAAAKAGLAGMTGALAVELAPDDITVNCIVPGRIDTPRPDNMPNRSVRHESPMGRSARQSEIADLIRFLCGPSCRYMSGQMLHVNGAKYITIA